MKSRACRLALSLSLFLVVSPLVYGTEALPIPPEIQLTAQERGELAQGTILLLPNPDKHLGGIALALLDAAQWKVWQVITDYPKYPEFFPRNISTKVLRSEGDDVFLRSEYRGSFLQPVIWSESRIHHETEDTDNLRMTWTALQTNLKVNYGYWLLRPAGTKTLVIYRADFDFYWIPDLLATYTARQALRSNIEAVKRRLADPRYDHKPGTLALIWREDGAVTQKLARP